MSSTILYKFRSGTTFEALPLPGSAARLFDVKKAIVQAKKLDQGSMEFDLSVRDATTNEEYTDENMLLPRGTRVVVQRLPAAKGHGFLSKLRYGGPTAPAPAGGASSTAGTNFYTIDSRGQEEDEEFVSTASASAEDKELAALRAATESANEANSAMAIAARSLRAPAMRGGFGGSRLAGQGPPPQMHHHNAGRGGAGADAGRKRMNMNADPELREQEKQSMPKKRATGIPRTFQNLSAPPATDGSATGEGGGANAPLIQTNPIGFEELVHRGGGQSESASKKRDLDYALKVTASTIPEYLQCAICNGVVKDAMMLPWDPEGRTTCESCIRDALTQNGFQCPLTNHEGVSPDDLFPNQALRKAAEQFIKGVMAKMEEVEKQIEAEEEETGEGGTGGGDSSAILEGDRAEKGVLVSRKTTLLEKKKHKDDDDPFGGGGDDDPFGGDVFHVDNDAHKPEEKEAEERMEPETSDKEKAEDGNDVDPTEDKMEVDAVTDQGNQSKAEQQDSTIGIGEANNGTNQTSTENSTSFDGAGFPARSRSRSPPPRDAQQQHQEHLTPSENYQSHSSGGSSRREALKRRGPPMGYGFGPAGQVSAVESTNPMVGRGSARGGYQGRSPRGGDGYNGRGGRYQDRSNRSRGDRGGRYGRERYSGRHDGRITGQDDHSADGSEGRNTRPRSDSESQNQDEQSADGRRDRVGAGRSGWEGRGSRQGGDFRGGGGYRGGGRHRGGGRWEDRGGRGYRGRSDYRGRGRGGPRY